MAIVKPIELVVVCGIAAVTALSIAVVPLVWHPRQKLDNVETLMAFAEQWPSRPIEPPGEPPPNVVPVEPALPVPTAWGHKVATITYRLVTEVPKNGLRVAREAREDREPYVEAPKRDRCWPGRKVLRHHGRSWRCVYNRLHR